MREKFKKSGFASFSDHELFEVLLFGVMRRENTNEIGHALLRHFGSVRGVLNATPEELLKIPKIGDQSVMSICLVTELMKRYQSSSAEKEKFSSVEKVGSFFVNQYIGIGRETVYILLLSNSLGYIDCCKLCEGALSSARLETDKICRLAFSKNAANIILAHNHPEGTVIPSSEDKNATYELFRSLSPLGLNLIEHFIIADGSYLPLMRNSEILAMQRMSAEMLEFEDKEYLTGRVY